MADPARIEALLDEVDALADPTARAMALDLVQELVDLYGEGLARVVEQADDRLLSALVDDELVAHLLLLHGLHPEPVEARVAGALEEVRPYLESHGGNVELVAVQDGVARLRLHGSCDGCPSSTATLKLAIEDAVRKAAPDLEGIEAEGSSEPAPALLQLGVSEALRDRAAPWASAGPLHDVGTAAPVLHEVGRETVLFVRAGEGLYAYRPRCPACGASLGDGALDDGELRCATCGHRYAIRAAGRCVDDPELHLDPIPLLHDGEGAVKVALG